MSIQLNLDDDERNLLIKSLRMMRSLYIDAQITATARLSAGDNSLRESLEAADERLLQIRALADRLGTALDP